MYFFKVGHSSRDTKWLSSQLLRSLSNFHLCWGRRMLVHAFLYVEKLFALKKKLSINCIPFTPDRGRNCLDSACTFKSLQNVGRICVAFTSYWHPNVVNRAAIANTPLALLLWRQHLALRFAAIVVKFATRQSRCDWGAIRSRGIAIASRILQQFEITGRESRWYDPRSGANGA